MLQIVSEPIDRVTVEANVGVHVIILIEVDSSELKVLWQRANVHFSHIVKIAQEHVFKHNWWTTRVFSIIEAYVELLESQMASLTAFLSNLEPIKLITITQIKNRFDCTDPGGLEPIIAPERKVKVFGYLTQGLTIILF